MTFEELAARIAALPDVERKRPAVAQTPDGKLLQVKDVAEVKADPRLNPVAIILVGDQ